MRHGNDRRSGVSAHLFEPRIAQLPCRHLQRNAVFTGIFRRRETGDMQLYPLFPAQPSYEGLVAVRLLAPQLEVAVSGHTPVPFLQQHLQQGHRVRAAAHCHQHFVLRPEETMLLNETDGLSPEFVSHILSFLLIVFLPRRYGIYPNYPSGTYVFSPSRRTNGP